MAGRYTIGLVGYPNQPIEDLRRKTQVRGMQILEQVGPPVSVGAVRHVGTVVFHDHNDAPMPPWAVAAVEELVRLANTAAGPGKFTEGGR